MLNSTDDATHGVTTGGLNPIRLFIHFDLLCYLTTLWVAKMIQYRCKREKLNSPQNRPQRTRGEVEVQPYSFFNLDARWGWVINDIPCPLYPWEVSVTHCIGGWVGHRDSLDRCGKSHPNRDSIPGPSSPQRVTKLTELSQPHSTRVDEGINMDHWWLYTDGWKPKCSEKNLLQCHFVHHQSHMD